MKRFDETVADKWEFRLGLMILVTTPLVISTATVDSFLMPKYVWAVLWGSAWLLLAGARSAPGRPAPSAVDWPIAATAAWFALLIALRYENPIQFQALLRLLIFVGLFYGFRRLWNRGLGPVTPTWALMGVTTFVSAYGLLQDYGIDFTTYAGGVRDWRAKVIATLGNPNFLGGFIAAGLPLFAAFALRRKTGPAAFAGALVCLSIITACLTVTFCVGATIGLIFAMTAGVAVALWLRTPPRVPRARAAAVFLVMVASVGWYAFDNPYNSHGGSLYKEALNSPQWTTGMGAREFNWRTTRIMMDERPWLGIGYGNYLAVHIHYQGLNYQRYGTAHNRDYVIPVDQPHFQLLETAAETGPVGVFILGWLFFAWWKAAMRVLRSGRDAWFARGAFLGVMAVTGHSFSSFPFHLPATSIAFVALASWFVSNPGRRTPPQSRPGVAWIATLAACALLNGYVAYSWLISDMHLRLGIESRGLASIAHLEEARAWNPFQHQVHFMLGVRAIEQGWHNQALESLRESLRYQEDHKTHETLARLYLRMNQLDNAIEEMRRVVELNPVYPGHRRELAELLRRAGMTAEAEAHERRARELEDELRAR